MKGCAILLLALVIGCTGPSGGERLPHRPGLSLDSLAREHVDRAPLFQSYQNKAISRWSEDWPWQLDFSGVSWDSPKTATAITPRHVVMAAHFQRKAGDRITFHDRKGRPHSRTLIKVVPLRQMGTPCDVSVGLLDTPVPRSVRTYPLPEINQAGSENLIGASAVITGHRRDVDFRRILRFAGNSVVFQMHPSRGNLSGHAVITGDSGNPSFLLCKGELVLIETHTTGGAGAGPYYGHPEIQNAILKVVAQTDPTYRPATISLSGEFPSEATGD